MPVPTPVTVPSSKAFATNHHLRRRNPLTALGGTAATTTSSSNYTPPLYQKILYPSNGSSQAPPRILHSSSHATLDPLILDLIALSLRAFVSPWYNGGISRDPDKDFLQAVTAVLVQVIQALEVRLAAVDWTELLLCDVPSVLEDHYRDWDLAEDKSRGPSAHNLSTEEMFHRLEPHVAISLGAGTPALPHVDRVYLRTLVDHVLKLLLPPEDYRAETERAIVREVLVGVVFGTVFGKVAQPWFLHGVIARLLEGREAAARAARKEPSTPRDSNAPVSPTTALDQIVSIVARIPTILATTLTSISTFVAQASSTVLPAHYYLSSQPLYSQLSSLVLAILPPSSTLAQAVHFIGLPLAPMSHALDAYLYRTVTTSFTTDETVKTVLEGITRGMFPNNGWPAPKEDDPDLEGQQELERRCQEAISRLLPR